MKKKFTKSPSKYYENKMELKLILGFKNADSTNIISKLRTTLTVNKIFLPEKVIISIYLITYQIFRRLHYLRFLT